jgi:DNA-binding CsgD family transcriptional regulator
MSLGSTLAIERPVKRKYFRPRPSDLARPALPALTPKQHRMAHLVIGLKTNAEIAKALQCHENSIKTQMSHMYRRVGVSGRLEFIRWFAREYGSAIVIRELLGEMESAKAS